MLFHYVAYDEMNTPTRFETAQANIQKHGFMPSSGGKLYMPSENGMG